MKARQHGFFSRYKYLLLVVFLSILPIASFFFTPTLFHSHDGLVHIPRIAAYHKAITGGNFPVRWAGDLNYGYGMPLFDFIYQTPYLVSTLFLLLGFGLVTSFKLSLSVSFIFAGIFMYLFAKAFFKDEKKAFLVALFYQFASFHIVELLVRASYGEIYTYTFLPLVLFGLYKFFEEKKYRYFILSSVATALLVISHNAISLAYFGVAVAFVLFFAKKKQLIILGYSSLFLGLTLSAFYWMPALLDHKYTYGDLFMKDLYKEHFAPLFKFFIPNFTNEKSLQVGGVAVQIGFFHVIAMVLAIWVLIKKKLQKEQHVKRILIFCLVLFLASFFFMTSWSMFLWERISLLRQFQFSWRLLSITVFCTSIFAVSYFYTPLFKKKWVYVVLIVLLIFSTVGYWKSQLGYDKINENYYWNFPLNTTYFGETDVIWSAGPAQSYPKKRVEIISGKGEIKNFVKKNQLHTFDVAASTPISIVDHTQYFPGWKVYVDKKEVPIQFQNPTWRGQITFEVPQGSHTVKVVFEETKVRLVADLLSVGTGALLLLSIPVVKRRYEI